MLESCVDFLQRKQHGVVASHYKSRGFIKTADQLSVSLKEINSDWFGLVWILEVLLR
jgi:hypothetical protein